MIEFRDPPLQVGLCTFMKLAQMWKACSSCAGYCIGLGEKFFSTGVKDVDEQVLPELSSNSAEGISPRVLPGYAILYWFAKQVYTPATFIT